MADFIDSLKRKYLGKKIPIVRVSDNGGTIEFFEKVTQDGGGILRDTWTGLGYEIPEKIKPIRIVVNNRAHIGYCVSEKGVAVNVIDNVKLLKPGKDQPDKFRAIPTTEEVILKYEGVIGKLTSLNMLEKGIDLEPNDRALWIRTIIGILIGWLLVAPMVKGLF